MMGEEEEERDGTGRDGMQAGAGLGWSGAWRRDGEESGGLAAALPGLRVGKSFRPPLRDVAF